jgi:hypothetical protein
MIERWFIWIGATLVLGSCAAYTASQMEQRYGQSVPHDRVVEVIPAGKIDYWKEVKPILEQRCIVCHACYDAPCQLKLSSIEGIERGASPVLVYKQSRLKSIQSTRLFEDAQTVAQWRDLGFHPVLNEYVDTPEANREAGIMHRILTQKDEHPLPDGRVLPDSFDLELSRKQFCAEADTFDEYASKHPLWGMPYALPGLEPAEQATLLQWLEQGAVYTARAPLPVVFQDEVRNWEEFLNGASLKAQLTDRYIYEHLFLAHLYFPDLDNRRFFRLVRSETPPGAPVQIIATRRPFNDPGVERVYYRLVEEVGTIVTKTHMPYALNSARMDRWRELFLQADFEVTELPSYDVELASNPFKTFKAIPSTSRYKFLLDEAQYTIGSFIKGPVCRGQVALNVINDRFWVFFIDPEGSEIASLIDFYAEQQEDIELPAANESVSRPLKLWRSYSKQQQATIASFDDYLIRNNVELGDISLDDIWDGDGVNDNAALTVFRHFDTATIEKGLIGRPPKTAWVIDYALLEKIHYLLVAGYDVFDNVGHQVVTRAYMDFLRMEGELNFLWMLPPDVRDRERAYWYRDADEEVMKYMTFPRFESAGVPAIDYQTNDEKNELFQLLAQRLEPVLSQRYDLKVISDETVRNILAPLEELVGQSATLMPQTAFLEIRGESDNTYVTLLSNDAHLNLTALFGEQKSRKPDEDTLSVVPGFLGAYPNAFFVVSEAELGRFVEMISSLQTEEDYALLLDNYGVRRTNPAFWNQGDVFHAAYRDDAPVEHGLFDYNRLENR